jgi:hypothetical protein
MLDIFDGLQTIEFGLAQGVEFKNLNALVIQDNTVCAPELLGYSIPKQPNIIEGFPNPTSGTTKTIKELEAEFTTALATYTTKQNQFMMESKIESARQLKTKPFYGKNVEVSGTTFDFSYAYINKYGYKHKFPNAASWVQKNTDCSLGTTIITEASYSSIGRSAADMSNGQPCIAGELINDGSTTNYAWVDVKGVKHKFTDISKATWHTTCRSLLTKKLTAAQGYDKIPTGAPMKATDACRKTYVSSALEAELSALNTKLTTLARQINTARAKEHSTNTQLGVTQTRYWNTFKNNANNYYSSTFGGATTDATLDAKEESSGLFATTNQMHFYIWFVFAILLLWYLLRVVYKSATSIYDPDTLTVFNWQNLIIFVCCIWIISVVWKWRPPWMRAEWYTIPAWLR